MTLTTIKKAGLDEIALDHVFTIGASGNNHYTFQGEGLNGTVNDPTLYLTRGQTYRFENGTGAHAIRIQSADDGTNGTLYNTGVTNNNTTGTVIVEVQHDAPDVLYYQCASHANMKGTIYITGALADGGVTSDKLAAGAVTNPKLGSSAVGAGNLQTNAVETAKIQDLAVTEDKLGATSVTASKIAQNAVSLDKLPLGNNTVDGKFLRANNGSAPTFETVNTTPADGSITTAKIANDAITSAQMAANSVNTSELIDDAVNSAKIADAAISNNHVNANAAIVGTKIYPDFGSQNIETTGNITCDGEFQPHWIGHQSQCTENTLNTDVYWKVAEVTGSGSEGGQIVFYGTTDYSGLGHNGQAARTTLILRHLTNNQLAGIWWTESGSYTAITDIRWKYTGSNNKYEIWVRSGAYSNVVPHITGSFDYAQTFGTSTGSATAPSGSTAFLNEFRIEMKDESESAMRINSEGIITYPTLPCFHGGNMANDSSGIVEYDQVHVNRGSHYSTADDRFVCPVDGVYFVALFGMSHNSVSTMDIAIRKNGADYQGVVPYSSGFTGQHHHVSGQGLVTCSEDDYLQVYIGSGSFYGTSSGRHSGFTVFLVA